MVIPRAGEGEGVRELWLKGDRVSVLQDGKFLRWMGVTVA